MLLHQCEFKDPRIYLQYVTGKYSFKWFSKFIGYGNRSHQEHCRIFAVSRYSEGIVKVSQKIIESTKNEIEAVREQNLKLINSNQQLQWNLNTSSQKLHSSNTKKDVKVAKSIKKEMKLLKKEKKKKTKLKKEKKLKQR